MPHHKGYKSKTRDMFSKPFRRTGTIPMSKSAIIFKRGDFVDIKVDGAVHKGMPHKFYHGKTGRVFNITPHAVGVIINKPVRGKILKKRIHARPEHLQLSRCREEFLRRVHENEKLRQDGNKEKLKRVPVAPREGHFVATANIVDQNPPIYKFNV